MNLDTTAEIELRRIKSILHLHTWIMIFNSISILALFALRYLQ